MNKSKLCVGAVSRRVVEEAAKLRLPQVVASRRQVDVGGGYIGMDQTELVRVVRELSDGFTKVVRDHGGPNQGGKHDDGTASFDADIEAGFSGIHIDVCEVAPNDRTVVFEKLLERYRDAGVTIEVGGEHTGPHENVNLLQIALAMKVVPSYFVLNFGTYVWRDQQIGNVAPIRDARHMAYVATEHGRLSGREVKLKAHNCDFWGRRHAYAHFLDLYNIAPEYALLETDAILTTIDFEVTQQVLEYAYASSAWTRWFREDEGTWFERARCALRYLVHDDPFVNESLHVTGERDQYVRRIIRDALAKG